MPLRPPQQKILECESRFKVVSAGRRFGKTFLSTYAIAFAASGDKKKNIFYIAPSYRQAKQIMWDHIKYEFGRRNWIAKVNESDLTITLRKNGTKISLRSADNPDSMRGVSLDYAVLDEAAFMKKETWTEVIRPALSDKKGGALFITTPKGRNWIYDLWIGAKMMPDWSTFQYTTIQGGNVDEDEVEAAKRELDERTFRQEYEATFETYAGMIYYAFEPERNVTPTTEEIGERTLIHAAIDFNVQPMSCALATVDKQNNIHVFDEIVINSSNTYELAEEINNRFPNNRIWAYPDASGQARKTSSNTSDHNILRQAGFVLKVGRINPPVRDRIAAVNSSFFSTSEEVKLTIAPNCKEVIKGLSNQTYKEGTLIPDKDSGFDHMNDAIGYLVNAINPITRPAPEKKTSHGLFGHY